MVKAAPLGTDRHLDDIARVERMLRVYLLHTGKILFKLVVTHLWEHVNLLDQIKRYFCAPHPEHGLPPESVRYYGIHGIASNLPAMSVNRVTAQRKGFRVVAIMPA
jgi:hypothetical protein